MMSEKATVGQRGWPIALSGPDGGEYEILSISKTFLEGDFGKDSIGSPGFNPSPEGPETHRGPPAGGFPLFC